MMETLFYCLVGVYLSIQAANAFVTVRNAESWAEMKRKGMGF
jgi:hypothetical protein